MRLKEVRDLVERRPFEPFRVCVSDGSSYDVVDPELLWLTKNTLYFMRYEEPGDELPVTKRLVDTMHITRVEAIGDAD